MEALKATKAREITKESVTEAETLVVNGIHARTSESPMVAGDFYFRPTLVQHVTQPSWFARTFLRRKQTVVNEHVRTIIISCPVCGLPILTSPTHRITQYRPLTIDRDIACPYSPTGLEGQHAFSINEGNIMPA
jgi:hypothetical protein